MTTRNLFGLAPIALAIVSVVAFVQGDATKPSDPAPKDDKPAHQYIGADKCKLCHIKKSTGEQYMVWRKSKHAKAFATLATPEAKEIGAKLGVEDPQKSEKCLKCHVTGYGEKPEAFAPTFKEKEGVGCETCHGPGSDYHKEDVHGKSRELGVKAGMLLPTEKTCLKCHNKESPSYKEFDFKKFSKEVEHPNPERKK